MECCKNFSDRLRKVVVCDECELANECDNSSCLIIDRAADAIENLMTENAALRRHIDNLTSAQAVMVKEFTEKLEELAQARGERDVVTKRLSAYEDTGMEPCDYNAMRAATEQCNAAKEQLCEIIRLVGATGADNLRVMAEAYKEGRMVILPCKVGDTVYTVQQVGRGHWEEDKYILDDRGTPKVYEKKFSLILLEYIGKNVFLTREEAEAALSGKGGDG